MFFCKSLAFSMIQWMLTIWFLFPLPFLNPLEHPEDSSHLMMKPNLENFEHYFASVWDDCSCAVVWAFFGIAFLWDWNENWPVFYPQASLVAQSVKDLSAMQKTQVRSLVGKIPWRRKRLPTSVFWPGEFCRMFSPWGHKESDMTERFSIHFTLLAWETSVW